MLFKQGEANHGKEWLKGVQMFASEDKSGKGAHRDG